MGGKAEKTKENIRQQAYQLFAEKGFEKVTMSDICARTGLSRGGLYRYYSHTGEIFIDILSLEYDISERIKNRESARAILNDMLETVEQEILDHQRSLSLAIYEYANTCGRELFIRLHKRAKERCLTLVQYGVETGEFRPVNPDQVSDLILYYYQGLRMWSRVIPLADRAATYYTDSIRRLLWDP